MKLDLTNSTPQGDVIRDWTGRKLRALVCSLTIGPNQARLNDY
jgi:hypothetical protein